MIMASLPFNDETREAWLEKSACSTLTPLFLKASNLLLLGSLLQETLVLIKYIKYSKMQYILFALIFFVINEFYDSNLCIQECLYYIYLVIAEIEVNSFFLSSNPFTIAAPMFPVAPTTAIFFNSGAISIIIK